MINKLITSIKSGKSAWTARILCLISGLGLLFTPIAVYTNSNWYDWNLFAILVWAIFLMLALLSWWHPFAGGIFGAVLSTVFFVILIIGFALSSLNIEFSSSYFLYIAMQLIYLTGAILHIIVGLRKYRELSRELPQE